MKSFFALIVGAIALGGVAHAQTTAEPNRGYAEGVAQSAFSNVTSQSYGVEVGVTVFAGLQVFVDAGQIRNVATSDIGNSAQVIAAFLTRSQPAAVSYSVKEPATFALFGVRYPIPMNGKVQPYVLGGFGFAKVKQDVTFSVGGTDVTANLDQYGVVLGSDLSGEFTKGMFSLGVGATYPIGQMLVVDLQYRYGRILADDQPISVSRAGIGVGVRF